MIESMLIIGIGGIGTILGLLLIFLPFILVRNRRLKSQASKRQDLLDAQAESLPQPSSLRRMLTLSGLVVLVIVWGFIIGFASGIIAQLFPIVFIYPIIMGINSGKATVGVIRRTKLRTISPLVLLSALSTLVIYGSYHYCRYLGFQIGASLEIFEGLSEATDRGNFGVTETFLDYALEEETGHSGFVGYILYTAKEGVSIGRITRSSSFNLGPVLTWLYWLLELGIIFGLTMQKGKRMISVAFCESCGNWVSGEKHLGGTTFANESFLLSLIRQKDFAGLKTVMEPNAEVPSLEVYYQGCQVCGRSSSQLVVRRTFQNTKGLLEFSDACQTRLQPIESVLLLNQFNFQRRLT